MKTRIYLTTGTEILEVYWIQHRGTDVYWGDPIGNHKGSYHASGEMHDVSHGRRMISEKRAPLQMLDGWCQLSTLVYPQGHPGKAPSRVKGDVILMLDAGTLPQEGQLDLTIGLLEPGRFDVLGRLMTGQLTPDGAGRRPLQLLLATHREPWVFVTLAHWVPSLGTG